jgi:PIN domain nuclease of toxin-antitoxin system
MITLLQFDGENPLNIEEENYIESEIHSIVETEENAFVIEVISGYTINKKNQLEPIIVKENRNKLISKNKIGNKIFFVKVNPQNFIGLRKDDWYIKDIFNNIHIVSNEEYETTWKNRIEVWKKLYN